MTRLEVASIGMVWFGQLYLLLHPAVGTGLAVDLMMLAQKAQARRAAAAERLAAAGAAPPLQLDVAALEAAVRLSLIERARQ